MDYSEVANSIAETIAKVTTPLTEEQRMVMSGAIAVWIDAALDRADTIRMPNALTAENGAKAALMGEFSVDFPVLCCCNGEQECCEVCGGSGQYMHPVNVPWTTIKEIYAAAVKHFIR